MSSVNKNSFLSALQAQQQAGTEGSTKLYETSIAQGAEIVKLTDRLVALTVELDNKVSEKNIRLQGLNHFFEDRKYWSKWIKGWITGQLVFQASLTTLLVLYPSQLNQDGVFLNIVTIQTLVQIVGMGGIIVAFYFKNAEYK